MTIASKKEAPYPADGALFREVAGVVLVPAPIPGVAVRVVLGTLVAMVSAVLWTRLFDRRR